MPSAFHNETTTLSARLNDAAGAKYRGAPNDIRHDAMFALVLDATRVHRSIGELADRGWSSSAGPLLRTLVDMLVSGLALTHSASPSLAAFRYLYSSFRKLNRLGGFSQEARKDMRLQLRQRYDALGPQDREEAIQEFKTRDRAYWFAPEWASPSAVIDAFVPNLKEVYFGLSGSAHGGFFGMRMYREDPDAHSIQPEPLGWQARRVELESSRFLLWLLAVRNSAENLGMSVEIDALSTKLAAIARGNLPQP